MLLAVFASCRVMLRFLLQAIEGVPKISEDYNPATWMLEVANHSVESRTGQDFAELYNNSDMRTCAAGLECARPSVAALHACPQDRTAMLPSVRLLWL
jgi:hypothetical protein